jgi:BlaI family penicillinase repressor
MRPKSSTLTAHELELMKIVWRHDGEVTVRDVYEDLRKQRAVAYTTVMTNMKTLEQKGYLRSTQLERAHVYRPASPKKEVIGQMVRDFVDRVFNGAGQPLVVQMLEDDQLSAEDLRDITRMLGKGKKA